MHACIYMSKRQSTFLDYLEGSLHRKRVRGNTVANPLLSLSSVPVQSANQGWKNSETNKPVLTMDKFLSLKQ